MKHTHADMGFTKVDLPAGTHICQIYDDSADRDKSLFEFIHKGYELQECMACFSDEVRESLFDDYYRGKGISLDAIKQQHGFSLSSSSEVYFENDVFDPDRMIAQLGELYKTSEKLGFSGARVIGEMDPRIKSISGGQRLLEYEAKVNLFLEDHPMTAVCQYNINSFSGSDIMDIIKVHPLMIVQGAVIANPFYTPPEQFLQVSP